VSDLRELLRTLSETQTLDPIDVQLAGVLTRRTNATGDQAIALALGAALTSRAVREGHSAITIEQLSVQTREMRTQLGDAVLAVPPDDEDSWWVRMLGSSTDAVGGATGLTPLVLDDGMLQFRRYYDAESRIAEHVRRSVQVVGGNPPAFSIITGGPGTGKTTMVARLLTEMVAREPELRVALAAPTGKAAARVSETMRQRLDILAADGATRARIPGTAQTLHRLLGYRPWNDRFERNQDNPLGEDLVIVDEASMVDVLMMDALLRALKPGARLILVGDHNQLASVDAGDVLGALCRAAHAAGPGAPLYECVTWLTKSWRFGEHPAIGALANAILAGDPKAVMKVCVNGSHSDVQLNPPPPDTDTLLSPLLSHLEECLGADSPAALLGALERFRVLAPEREGRLGVEGINTAIERWLARRGHPVHERWYHGRPVLVTANDYSTGIFNGDLGVVWREGDSVMVHFPAEGGGTRAVAPAKLPLVATAWAMTVHKSQGSEFDEVLVVLPEHESRVLGRELLYTAVTRARQAVTIFASEVAMRQAVARPAERTSGLVARLGDEGGVRVRATALAPSASS
jgi:exodeoxyribonuclease V alpha subunit